MFQRETQRWVHHKFIQTHGATDECECAGAGPALQAREIKDISHLWIRVRWPLQGSGRRPENLPGAQVPMGMLMIFPSNAALRFCWVQYLTDFFEKKLSCYGCGTTKAKSVSCVHYWTLATQCVLWSSSMQKRHEKKLHGICSSHTCCRFGALRTYAFTKGKHHVPAVNLYFEAQELSGYFK